MSAASISLGPVLDRAALRRKLDVAVAFAFDRVKEQLIAFGFSGADLEECLSAERLRLARWRDEVEAEIGRELPEAPPPAASAA